MKEATRRILATPFGLFSRAGDVVMVFGNDQDVESARQSLLENGFSEKDITIYGNRDVIAEFKNCEEHAASSPSLMGQLSAKIEQYLILAEEGCRFLILHAPLQEAAESAVEIVRPIGLRLADKYNRLTIERLE